MLARTLLTLLVVAGCSATVPEDEASTEPPNLLATDRAAYESFPNGLGALAASHLPTDESGLIGRNQTWGALYSPRFQLGAGAALRTTIAAERPAEVGRAFRAVEAGTEVVRPDGSVPSSLPPNVGGSPSAADIASGAAFFLGDACLGLLALTASDPARDIVTVARQTAAQESAVRAVRWLLTQQDRLMAADDMAPNRLLFDARAFQACGALSSDADLRVQTQRATDVFVDEALGLLAADGHFVEGGGYDTSYQGVAIRVGEDVLLAGYADDDGQLEDGLDRATAWLVNRVDAEGRIDSSGNTRTCDGGETVFGEPKLIAVPEVFAGLVYASVRTSQLSISSAARRIEEWANAGLDPCFP